MLHIRRGRLDDLEAIERVESSCFRINRFEREVLIALLDQEGFHTWIAEDDHETLGYASILRREDGPLRLLSIAVMPSSREKGIGKNLLARVKEYARAAGRSRISLEVRVSNVPAINLYLASGYRIKGLLKDYYTKGKRGPEDALYMILDLED